MSSYSQRVQDLAAQLDERTTSFLRELEALDPAQREFRPAADSWSILDVAHHLVLIEQSILEMALKPHRPLRRSLKDRFGHLAVKVFLTLGMRVKAPSKTLHPTDPITLDELEARWLPLRSELEEIFFAGKPDESLFRHPYAGPLNGESGFEFLVIHFDHHMKQVARVRRSEGFPQP